MKLRILLLAIIILSKIYDGAIRLINIRQRERPLPPEVADIYDKSRYERFLAYKKDYFLPSLISDIIAVIISCVLLLTPYFHYMEILGKYKEIPTLIYTIFISLLLPLLIEMPLSYYETFVIEERYGKNKKTRAMFFKDQLIESIFSIILYALIFTILYLITHKISTSVVTDLFHAVLITALLLAIIGLLYLIITLISYLYLHIHYQFKPLEDGELKTAIMDLMKDSKKKVRVINEYNESARSTSKNAFLLKMPFHKEFGIADNFISENAKDELLAVLAHEVGHLKHKKNIFNYLSGLFAVIGVIILILIISHLNVVSSVRQMINIAFGITTDNLYLYIYVIMTLFTPLGAILSVYHNYVSRREEYEADDNAVKEGYGQALIRTFKQISYDEFIDVNPSPITEFLEYDHPGMFHRITHIEKAMKEGDSHEKTDPQ